MRWRLGHQCRVHSAARAVEFIHVTLNNPTVPTHWDTSLSFIGAYPSSSVTCTAPSAHQKIRMLRVRMNGVHALVIRMRVSMH
jgi:hypothetical protein